MQYCLEVKTSECITKRHENKEVTMGCEYKVSKYTAEIEKLKAKLEIVPEKDRRIFELQSKNAKLYLGLKSYEEIVKSQLEMYETLQNELEDLKTSMDDVKQKNAESE